MTSAANSYSAKLQAIVKGSGDPMSDWQAEEVYELALEMAEKLDATNGPNNEAALRAEAATNHAKYEGAVGACMAFAADAARYRWLRDRRITGFGVPSLATWVVNGLVTWDANADDTDKAIDACMRRSATLQPVAPHKEG